MATAASQASPTITTRDGTVIYSDSALLSSKIVPDATLRVYPGASHGLTATHGDQFNADLLEFVRA